MYLILIYKLSNSVCKKLCRDEEKGFIMRPSIEEQGKVYLWDGWFEGKW